MEFARLWEGRYINYENEQTDEWVTVLDPQTETRLTGQWEETCTIYDIQETHRFII